MRKEDCFYVGKIVKKHSYKGEVVLYLDTDEPQLYSKMESIFVALGDNLVPFFIEKSSPQKTANLRVKFEDVDSEEEAEAIIGSELYLPLDLLPKLEGNKFYYHEIIGFTVVDTRFGNVGTIKTVNDNTSQALFVIDREGVEILIPMVDEFIKKVDRETNTIQVEVPEGLIEMYLEE